MFQQSNFTTLEKAADNLFSSEKVWKKIYQILVKRKTSWPVKSQGKWLAEDIFSNVQLNWENTYQPAFPFTTETKLSVFQFQFLHRRVATSDFKIGKKETHSCSSCAGSPETLTHLFGIVDQLRMFWYNVSQWTSENPDLTNLIITPFSPALCLGLIDKISNLLLHHFLFIAKLYIYSCKLRNTIPMVHVYTQLVIRSMEIEKQIAFDNNNLGPVYMEWGTPV